MEAIEKEYENFVKNSNYKYCPKCKVKVEKSEGCNHMTCVICKYEFCWICLKKYTSNHFAYWNFCACPGLQHHRINYKSFSDIYLRPPLKFLLFLGLSLILVIILIIIQFIFPIFFSSMILYHNNGIFYKRKIMTFIFCLFFYPLVLVYGFAFIFYAQVGIILSLFDIHIRRF